MLLLNFVSAFLSLSLQQSYVFHTSLGQASCPDLYVVSSRQHRGLYQNAPERRIELPVQERKSVRLVCYGFHY